MLGNGSFYWASPYLLAVYDMTKLGASSQEISMHSGAATVKL